MPWDVVPDRRWDQTREGFSGLDVVCPEESVVKGETGLGPEDTAYLIAQWGVGG